MSYFAFIKKKSTKFIKIDSLQFYFKIRMKIQNLSSEMTLDWDESWVILEKDFTTLFPRFTCLFWSDRNDITSSSRSRKQTKEKKLQSEGPSVNTLTTLQSELEAFPLSWIAKTRAVLDSCAYNSLLILTVEDRNKRLDQIYMFQCEEMGVSHALPEPQDKKKEGASVTTGCGRY